MKIYKFNPDSTAEKPTIDNPKEFLVNLYQERFAFGLDNVRRSGIYKIGGWAIDFNPFLKRFIVKQWGDWQEYRSPNKTLLKKSLFGRIQKIVEIV